MKKRTFFILFALMLAILLVLTLWSLPKAPPLPSTLTADENGWYWGESEETLAAAVPEEEGLTVFWVDRTDPTCLFYRKSKTADLTDALEKAGKRPLYLAGLDWTPPKNHSDSRYMDIGGKLLLEEAGAQPQEDYAVAKLQLPSRTHKAGIALLTAAILEADPQKALESMEENVWEGIWNDDRLTRKQEFYYYRGLVEQQWYNLWGTTADVEHRGSTDAQDHLYPLP